MTQFLLFSGALVYVTLAFAQSIIPNGSLIFGYSSTIIQVALDVLIVAAAWDVIRTYRGKYPGFKSLVVGFSVMAVGDLVYGVVLNILGLTEVRASSAEVLYFVIYMFALAAMAFFFYRSAQQASKELRNAWYALIGLSFVLFASIFGSQLLDLPLSKALLHVACLSAKCVILSGGAMGAMLYRSSGRRLVSSGFLVILSYSILIEYLEIQNGLQSSFPMEIFWTMGLAAILIGIKKLDAKAADDVWDSQSLSSRLTVYSLILAGGVICSWLLLQYLWQAHFPFLPPIGIATSWTVLLLVCMGSYSYFVRSRLVEPMHELTDMLRSVNHTKSNSLKKSPLSQFTEFSELSKEILVSFKALQEEKEKSQRLSLLASHMSHDIRSPLAALRMLTAQTDSLPEETREMMVQIASRINLIAENLLEEHRQAARPGHEPVEARCLLYGVVETIISERRILLPRSRIQLELNVSDAAYGCWVQLDAERIGRTLSNLLNNSVEAFESNPRLTNPRVSVVVSRMNRQTIRISVQDNAGGLPEKVEQGLRQGESVTTKTRGSGLGLTQARETLELVGGKLDIFTQSGFGTVINVLIPIAETPAWCTSSIRINPDAKVLVIDDDQSIHSVWRSRLGKRADIISCYTNKEAEEAIKTLPEGSTILADYHLRGEPKTGADFLASVKGKYEKYLVTSHYSDGRVQFRIKDSDSKIVPKFLAPFVELHFTNSAPKAHVDMYIEDEAALI